MTPQETEPKLLVLGGLLWRRESAGAHSRDGRTGGSCLGRSPLVLVNILNVGCQPLLTHASTGDPPTLAALVQFPVESLLLSSMPWYAQNFVCALQDWSLCFPQSCGSLVIKSHWPSRSDFLGIPSPFVGSPGWEA